MVKYLFITLALVSSLQLFAVESVRLRDDVDLVVSGTTDGNNLTLFSVETTAESPETAPAKVYLPMLTTLPNSSYYLYSVNGLPRIFDISASSGTDKVNFPLRVNTSASDRYLHVAIKDTIGSGYKYLQKYSLSPFPQNSTNSDTIFPLIPNTICTVYSADCIQLAPSSGNEVEKTYILYFFLSNQANYGAGDVIDVTTAPLNTGVYFEVNMSNRTYLVGDIQITVPKVRIGDKRLILEYSANGTIAAASAKEVRVFKHTSPPTGGAVNQPIGDTDYHGILLPRVYPYADTGEVTVTDIPNGTPTTVSVLFVDKYLMATTLSNEVTGTPLEIQELLKKQACFLLTAGFGEEHFIISYFRNFRDTVLASSYLGRKFINFYYSTAPKYALIIYQHEFLRASIRGAAYVLYFIFNYIYLIAFVLLGSGGLIFYRHKKKNLQDLAQQ